MMRLSTLNPNTFTHNSLKRENKINNTNTYEVGKNALFGGLRFVYKAEIGSVGLVSPFLAGSSQLVGAEAN